MPKKSKSHKSRHKTPSSLKSKQSPPLWKNIFLVVLVITFLALLVQYINGRKAVVTLNDSPDTVSKATLIQSGDVDISVCDPSNERFSTNITNEFLPLPIGMVHVLEDTSSRVEISVLDEIEYVAGIPTRVVAEREWENNELIETSRNFFVQASDGTVCYYGEDVDMYKNGQIVSHEGAWRAGEGDNKPGIFMPANPAVGQKYQQEIAPDIAVDRAEHIAMGETFTTPVGTYTDVLLIQETPPSTKRYQRGVGLIYDAGAMLTLY